MVDTGYRGDNAMDEMSLLCLDNYKYKVGCKKKKKRVLERQSISNQLRVGLFESDHSTQTDVSEVVEIKELTSVIQSLTQSLDILRKEVVLQKNLLQAEYDQKIEDQALELYNRMNDTVRDLEMVHKKKVSTLRKSFQQQLIDALAVIRSKYENHYNGSSDLLKSIDSQADSAKVQELRRKIIEKDLVIQSLEAQITELVDNEPPQQIVYQSEDDPEKEKLLEDNKELQEKAESLQDRVHQLEIVLKERDGRIQALDLDVGAMRVRMEEDQRTIEKLVSQQEELKIELENEKSSGVSLLQQQKEEMENILKTKLAEKEKEQAQVQRENEEKALREIQRQKEELMAGEEQLRSMMEKMERMKTPKVDVNMMNADKERLEAQIRKLLSVKEEDAKTIERLQKELERLNKTWEKKFDILKQSFHAIKDEMFLRQSLHRQAMNLHRVSVSYMADGTLAATPTDLPVRSNFYLPSMPLPQIGSKPPAMMTRAEFPSNLMDSSEQALFPEDELQVVSDTEEDLGGVPPLPPPPPDTIMENQVKQS
ncbi:uncharacterized protein C10orf67 homolog, mitochondrial isoform X2 [Dendropsophus ebraccatus]|uniref:uncharacterized protein C10orf67 homolog, mitochondrial isoform X2 n=1 Tax=Dendropsophus ebraccatus TaxID=150705 RepID=UPI0038316768